MSKKNTSDFIKMKENGEKITYLVVYDYNTAHLAEEAGVDMLLVGDTLGPAVYGYNTLLPVTMEQMIAHCQAVRKGASNTFIVGDPPFLSYETSASDAVKNAGRLIKESNVDAVKPEGGENMIPQIKAIVNAGILVQGHVGFTPHFWGRMGGRVGLQADKAEAAIQVFKDAKAVEEAGAFSIAVVGVPAEVSKAITETLKIPVICMGAGPYCDGQILLSTDMLGITRFFISEYVKRYADISEKILSAFKEYVDDVKERRFPEEKHYYSMEAGERERFEELLKQYKKDEGLD